MTHINIPNIRVPADLGQVNALYCGMSSSIGCIRCNDISFRQMQKHKLPDDMKDPEQILEERMVIETNSAVFWVAGLVIAGAVYWQTDGNWLVSLIAGIFGVVMGRMIFLGVRYWFARKHLRRHL